MDALGLFDNALLQGLTYAIGVLGVAVAFRVLRYPDLTADGSFLLGSVGFAAALESSGSWVGALVAALVAGAAAGLLTATLHTRLKVARLLTGVLTTMMAYSIAFRMLRGRANLSIRGDTTLFSGAREIDAASGFHPAQLGVLLIVVAVVSVAVMFLLRTEVGLTLRAAGGNLELVGRLGVSPTWIQIVGLVLANGLVALSGAVLTARQGFADVNAGFGVIITLIASLVIGEELCRQFLRIRSDRLVYTILTPLVGGAAYFLLYLLVLRASLRGWLPISIQPTDLKFLSAVVVVAAIFLNSFGATGEEEELLF